MKIFCENLADETVKCRNFHIRCPVFINVSPFFLCIFPPFIEINLHLDWIYHLHLCVFEDTTFEWLNNTLIERQESVRTAINADKGETVIQCMIPQCIPQQTTNLPYSDKMKASHESGISPK